jgi:hypothetical protein
MITRNLAISEIRATARNVGLVFKQSKNRANDAYLWSFVDKMNGNEVYTCTVWVAYESCMSGYIGSYDSQKSKSGTFNPNRHFHTWWSHILAKEDELEITNNDPDNDLFEKLHFIIKRDKKVLRFLTVIDIRNMLRELKRSELNKNISYGTDLLDIINNSLENKYIFNKFNNTFYNIKNINDFGNYNIYDNVILMNWNNVILLYD